MWRTSGVAYGRAVDNLSGSCGKPPCSHVPVHHSELRIPGSFQQKHPHSGAESTENVWGNTADCPKSSDGATSCALILRILFGSRFTGSRYRKQQKTVDCSLRWANGQPFLGNYACSSSTVCRMTPWAEMSRTMVSAPGSSSIIAFCIALATFSALAGSARAAMLGPAPDRKLP